MPKGYQCACRDSASGEPSPKATLGKPAKLAAAADPVAALPEPLPEPLALEAGEDSPGPLPLEVGDESAIGAAPPSSQSGRLIEAVGSVAAMCTTFAFVPQAWTIIATGDTAGLSLGMYVIFFSGVLLWIAYGVLKKSPSLLAGNTVTAILSGFILLQLLRHLLHPTPQLSVAVCAVGPARTLAHPRVIGGLREELLLPGWRLFAAIELPLGSRPTGARRGRSLQ